MITTFFIVRALLQVLARSTDLTVPSLSHMPTAYDSHAHDDHIPVPSEYGAALDQLVAVLQAAGVSVHHQECP